MTEEETLGYIASLAHCGGQLKKGKDQDYVFQLIRKLTQKKCKETVFILTSWEVEKLLKKAEFEANEIKGY